MKLKEMAGYGVMIDTINELDEYVAICSKHGWSQLADWRDRLSDALPTTISIESDFCYNLVSGTTLITLSAFKETQGIMNYKEGDVLVDLNDSELTVHGTVGPVYVVTAKRDGTAYVYSEVELQLKHYSLKTDEPELTTLTMEDVAKLAGIAVDSLRIEK